MSVVDKYLNHIELFKGLSPQSLELLGAVCRIREFRKKEVLFFEGEPGRALHYLVGGDIQLFKNTSDGKEIVIKVVKPGELFAEVILFEKEFYPVSAMALSPATVLLIPKEEFYSLLDRSEFRNNFIAVLMQKLRYLGDRILQLSTESLEDRLRGFLEGHFGRKKNIFCPLSKKDVAAAIGATPESLSRLLPKLARRGLLVWEGSEISTSDEFWV